MIMFLYSMTACSGSIPPGFIDTYSAYLAGGSDPQGITTEIAVLAFLFSSLAWVFPTSLFKKKSSPWITIKDNKELDCNNTVHRQVENIIPVPTSRVRNNKKKKSPPALSRSKNMNQLLIDNEAFAVLILDSIAEAVCGFDMSWRCVFSNKSFGKTFSFHNDEDMIGFNVHDLIHHKRPDGSSYHGHECRILNSQEWHDSKTYFGEELFFRMNGSCFVGECWVHPIKDGNETIGGVMSITDITSKKNLQKETEELKGHILQSEKFVSLGKQTCGITHDFNNVLMGIRCYTELVLSEIDNHASNHKYLRHVIQATDRAQSLIKEISLFSKPYDEKKKPFDIVYVTKDVVQLIKATMPANIKIKELFLLERCQVFGMKTGFFRVILNVCQNAAHAMKEVDEGVLEIKVYHKGNNKIASEGKKGFEIMPPESCVVEITDNGCGMNQEIMEKIYEPYFTTNKSDGGTGLGLSIVNSIVAAHKGHIEVDSTPGKGTRFQILFPYTDIQNGLAEDPPI